MYQLISLAHETDELEILINFISRNSSELVVISDDINFLEKLISNNSSNLYVEWTPGMMSHNLRLFAKAKGLSLVGTYRIRFEASEDLFRYRLLKAIELNQSISEIEYAKLGEGSWLFPTDEKVRTDFQSWPEAVSLTYKIAVDCIINDFTFQNIFPEFKKKRKISEATLG